VEFEDDDTVAAVTVTLAATESARKEPAPAQEPAARGLSIVPMRPRQG
jgi:hypothetical protein